MWETEEYVLLTVRAAWMCLGKWTVYVVDQRDSLQFLNTLPLSSYRVQFDSCSGWLRMSVDVSVHQHPYGDFLGLNALNDLMRSQLNSHVLRWGLASVVQCWVIGTRFGADIVIN